MNFNDFVTVQASRFLAAIVDEGESPIADLALGVEVQRVIDAMAYASDNQCWVRPDQF